MSTAKYAPKLYAKNPLEFGKKPDIAWITATSPREKDELAASKMQHEFAYKVRARAAELGLTLTTYSSMSSLTYDRNAKILRGEALMRLDFLTEAERLIGHIVSAQGSQ